MTRRVALEGPAAAVAGLLDLHLGGFLDEPAVLARAVDVLGGPGAALDPEVLARARGASAGHPAWVASDCSQCAPSSLCIRCRTVLRRWWDVRDALAVELVTRTAHTPALH